VEDYFQVENLRPYVAYDEWARFEPRVERNVEKVLSLFDEFGVKSTFFILGWVAERFPALVRTIHQGGHEIASHGYGHQMIQRQTRDEFRADVRRAKAILEDIIGESVIGYRAPTFSITEQTVWALDVLAEEGYLYDSSIFPVRHDRYGFPRWSRYIEKTPLHNGLSLIEVPPATARLLGVNLPAAGGGYFRLAPLCFFSWAVHRLNQSGQPAVLYLHPWEFDPDQPRFPIPPLSRFRHYVNLASTEKKLRKLLSSASFTRLRDILSV
jgi:polysaccharide deacetylase family protein (PEP-CTERM system associated)